MAKPRRGGARERRGGAAKRAALPVIKPVAVGAAIAAFFVGAWFVARSLGIHLSVLDSVLVAAVVNLGVAIPSRDRVATHNHW